MKNNNLDDFGEILEHKEAFLTKYKESLKKYFDDEIARLKKREEEHIQDLFRFNDKEWRLTKNEEALDKDRESFLKDLEEFHEKKRKLTIKQLMYDERRKFLPYYGTLKRLILITVLVLSFQNAAIYLWKLFFK